LGHLTYFPWVQPEQTYFEFDYSVYDERKTANVLLQLTAKESWNNLTEVKFIRGDGTEDPLPLGIPRMWETLEKMPTRGKFSGLYICSPDDQNFKIRASFQETYALWKAPERITDVTWWCSLIETPEDVIEYLEFLVARCKNMQDAFRKIDGPGGNGQITMREFEESITEMKCKKFKGDDESARLSKIFRFLDPSGEGQVSECEWAILDLVDREIRLSIKEFVQFLARTFGDDLENAWDAFDEDGGGEIEYHEWEEKLEEVGFFGPGRPIFSFLDKDEGGSISWEEFERLIEFQPEANSNRKRSSMISTRHTMNNSHGEMERRTTMRRG